MGRAIQAGQAVVTAKLDDGPLKSGLAAAQKMVLKWGAGIAAAGAGVVAGGASLVAPILASFKSAVDEITTVRKAAEQLGAGTAETSALGYAAQKAGLDFDSLVTSSRHMQTVIAGAADGEASATNALARLGIKANELAKLPLQDQFARIADGIAALPDPAHQAQAALDIFGRSGADLLPVLRDGAAGLAKIRKEAEDMGAIVSPEDAKQAKDFTKAIGQAQTAIEYFYRSVGASILPQAAQLKEYSDIFAGFVRQARRWVEENRALVVGVFAVGAGIVALGGALIGVGSLLAASAVAVGGFAAAFSAAGAVIATVFSSPVIIVGALALGFAALTAAVLADAGTLEDAAAIIQRVWRPLVDLVSSTFTGVTDALRAGDLELALKVAVAGLDVIWKGFLVGLQLGWNEFKNVFVDGWIDAITELKVLAADLANFLRKQVGDIFNNKAGRFLADHPEFGGFASLVAGAGIGGASEEGIRAAGEKAKADAHAARAADGLAAALELGKAVVAQNAAVREANVAANTKLFGDFMNDIANTAIRGQAVASVLAGGVRGGFAGGNLGAQFSVGSADVQKQQLDVQKQIEENTRKPAGVVGF